MTEITVPDAERPDGKAVRMHSIALQDFSQALQGMREGRRYARIVWRTGNLLFLDKQRQAIFAANNIQLARAFVWSPLPADIVATDWIEVIG